MSDVALISESFDVIRSIEGFEDFEDDVDGAPVGINRVRSGEYELVGNGEPTNSHCGHFTSRYEGCDRVDLHNKTIIDESGNLINCKGKAYIRKRIYYTCHNPRCPVCYDNGWGIRESKNIQARLKEASKRFGQVEHIIISVPVKDYYLDLEEVRVKVNGILREIGVIGGCIIPHGFRYKKYKGWYWSPHFHVLGFILGGYRRCRRCPRLYEKRCLKGCGGFNDRKYWIGYKKFGYIVKVLGERKSVFRTARYQLSHGSIKRNTNRYHCVTWFGCCSYRKLEVTVEMKKRLCPICQYELRRDITYVGLNEEYYKEVHDFVANPFVDYREGVDNPRINTVVWVRVPQKSWKDRYGQELTVREPVSIDEAFRVE